jgi:hypothetical protein
LEDLLWAEPERMRDEQVRTLAKQHWSRWLPERYSQISDPETFFAELGEQVMAQVTETTDRLAGPDPADEGYLEKVGR